MDELRVGGVARADVIWCFRNIFGRDIKEEDIGHFLKTEESFRTLVTTLLHSREFQRKFSPSSSTSAIDDGFLYEKKPTTQKFALDVLRMIEPHKVNHFEKVRVGHFGDGGYVMLNDFNNIEAAYSLGINDDITWDRDIAGRGINIYQYDHTIDRLPEENPYFHWSKIGISAKPQFGFDTLPNLMAKNGHAASTELLLKCDIEGHEWDMLCHITPRQLAQFRQIVVETHGWQLLTPSEFGFNIERAIANITAGHRLIHVHANNHAAYSIVGGIPLPAVLELTFVRAAGKELSLSHERFPTPLDAPCKVDSADYQLGQFRF